MAKTQIPAGYIAANAITATEIAVSSVTPAHLHTTLDLSSKTLTIGATTVSGHLIPDTNITYDLGSSTYRFRDIYLDGNTINLGGTELKKNDAGDIEFKSGSNFKKLVISELEFDDGTNRKKIKIDSGKIKTFDSSGSSDTADKISLAANKTDDLGEGTTNLYFTNERVDDRVNSLLTAGTGITLTYDDANNTLTIAGSAQYGDSDARSAISVSGNALSYNSSTGVITANYEESPTFTGTVTSGAILSTQAGNNDIEVRSVGDYFPSLTIARTGGTTKTNYEWNLQIGSDGYLNFKDITNGYYPLIFRNNGDVYLGNNTSAASPVLLLDQSAASATFSGNIIVSGTVDGRDIATDGTKLDGIESGATADQTQSDINALGITAIGLSGTPNITVGTINSGTITTTGDLDLTGTSDTADEKIILPRGGHIAFYGNGSLDHAISSMGTDDIRINSYGEIILNLDSNNNNTVDANFRIVKHGGGSSAGTAVFSVDGENGNVTATGTLQATSFSDGTISGITFIDEDSFATNSATRVPTQQSIKAYVDAQVAGVVDSAPAALNTLNELAAALGDDANFATTTSTALGNRLRVDTAAQGLTGTQQANAITNLGITATQAELNYVDGVTSNIQTQLDAKLASSSYTASDVLTKIKTVDGSGSGLDADLLDGKQPPTNWAATAQTYTTIASAGWDLPTGSSVFSKADSSGGPGTDGYWFVTGRRDVGGGFSGIYTPHNDGKFYSGYSLTDSNPTWYEVWTSGSDGSGSGLDADLLDGQHGSYYAPASTALTTSTTFGGDVSGTYGAIVVADDSHNHIISNVDGLQTALDAKLTSSSGLNASNIDSGTIAAARLPSPLNSLYSNAVTGSAFATTGSPSSVLEYAQASGVTDTKIAPTSDWYNSIRMGHGNPYSYYSNTIAMQMTGTGAGKIRTQLISNNNAQGWRTVWDSSIDGSGSGLDADLLDGIDSGSFLRSDADDTASGSYTFTNSYNSFGNSTGSVSNDGSWNARVNIAGSSHARFDVKSVSDGIITTMYSHTGHGGGKVGTYSNHPLYLMTNASVVGTLATSGSLSTTAQGTLWGASNDGAGSGLDADTVDGIHASSFLRSDAADTATGTLDLTGRVNIGDSLTRPAALNSDSVAHLKVGAADVHLYVASLNSTGGYKLAMQAARDSDFASFTMDLQSNGGELQRGGNKVWDAGNDGSGSTLDADLLDGLHASSFARTSAIASINMNNYAISNLNDLSFNDPGPNEGLRWIGGSDWRIYESPDDLATNSGGNLQFTTGGTRRATLNTSGSLWTSGQGTLWGASNDGSGSGLDADTVDGYQAGNLRIINSEYNGSVGTAGWYTIAEYGGGRAQGEFHVYDQDSSRHNYVKLHVVWSFGHGGITCVSNGKHGTVTITHARLLYNTTDQTYGGCKLQIYCSNPTWTLRVRQVGSQFSSWGAFTQTTISQADSVTNFAEYSRASNLHLNGGLSTSGSTWYAANNLVWHAGNDGSGSGLDADLLDGQHGSYYQPASTAITTANIGSQSVSSASNIDGIGFVNTGSNSATNADTIDSNGISYYTSGVTNFSGNATDGALFSQRYSSSWQHQIAGDYRSGQIALRGKNNGTWQSWRKVWDASNDGSGSGLDADLLDGYHASTTRNAANTIPIRDANGYLQLGWINTTSGDSGIGNDVARIYCSHDAYLRYLGKSDFKVLMGLSKDTYDRRDYTTDANYHTGVNAHGSYSMNDLFNRGSGFIDVWSSPAGRPPSGTHFNGFQALHYSASTTYHHGMQMVMSAGNPSFTYLRGWWANGGSGYDWQKIWTDGNDGSGSGLDADTVDGIQGATLQSGSLGTDYYVNALYHDDWVRNHYNNNGHYWSATGWHLYVKDAQDFYMRSGTASNAAIAMAPTGTVHGYVYVNSSNEIGFLNNGRSWTFKVDSSGNCTATGNVTAYSDIRLKEDIKPIENALLTVTKLEGVSYTRKATGKKEIGFVAQDVKKIIPELVEIIDGRTTDELEESKGIEDLHVMKYQNTVALLVEAIKEQQKQIEKLTSRINDIEKGE